MTSGTLLSRKSIALSPVIQGMRSKLLGVLIACVSVALLCSGAAQANVVSCASQRIANNGFRIPVWAISVRNTTCRAAHKALAPMVLWKFATPSWRLVNGFPTRYAPSGWRRCHQLGLWVNKRAWSDGNVMGSMDRCTGSGGRELRFSAGHTAHYWVNYVGCVSACPVTVYREP
jgi:hypothetical protein